LSAHSIKLNLKFDRDNIFKRENPHPRKRHKDGVPGDLKQLVREDAAQLVGRC